MLVPLTVALPTPPSQLINVQLVPEASPEWKQADKSIVRMINMGLYTDMDSKLTYLTRDPILVVLYEIYMFVVQVSPT